MTYRDQQFKLVRVKFQDVPKMKNQELDTIKKAPSIFVIKDSRYFEYNGEWVKHKFMRFLNKIIYPFMSFKKVHEIEKFLDPSKDYEENTGIMNHEDLNNQSRQFRAIFFLSDRSLMPQIMRKFSEASENLANRDDLRLGYVGDRAKIQSFVKNHQIYQLLDKKNFILLVSDDKNFKVLDLEQNPNQDIEEWTNMNSIDQVQEIMDQKTVQLIDLVKTAILILFLDDSDKSVTALSKLREISESYKSQIIFTFIKDTNLVDIRYELGATHKSLPTVTIVTGKGIIFPFRNDVFTAKDLEEYINSFVTRRLRPINNEQFLATIDQQMERRLMNTKHIGLLSLNETVIDNTDKDVVVFFHSTELDTVQWRKSLDIASSFDTTAQRFKDNQFDTVLLCSYDYYRFGLPEWLMKIEVPSIILFPAKNKESFQQYDRPYHKTRSHMEFIQKFGDTKIELTDRSHLPPRIVKVGEPGKHYNPKLYDL